MYAVMSAQQITLGICVSSTLNLEVINHEFSSDFETHAKIIQN